MAFVEMHGTFKKKKLPSGTVPADRSGDLEKIRKEIELIESQIEKLRKVEHPRVAVEHPGLDKIESKVGTVPPKTNVQKSSRKSRVGKSRNAGGVARKGIKPIGENGELWKAKLNMRRMFIKKKLLCGVVPPTSTATPTSKNKMKLLAGAVAPTSTATPTERNQEELLGRTVPPTSDATPEVRKN